MFFHVGILVIPPPAPSPSWVWGVGGGGNQPYLLFNFYSGVDIFIFAFANRVASSVLIPILIAQYSCLFLVLMEGMC